MSGAPSGSSFSTHPPTQSLDGAPGSTSTAWVPLGPAPLASDATGDGGQNYNWVSGRATSVLIDPADTSGNTVLLGGAFGGLWRSTNAGSLSPDPNPGPASVVWQPLIDDQPTLAVGAIALQPGNSNIIVVGTGETNNSSDSYYGLGILLSTNGGSTWTHRSRESDNLRNNEFSRHRIQQDCFQRSESEFGGGGDGGRQRLVRWRGSGVAGGGGPCLGPQEDGSSTVRGLYYSLNAGSTWNRATLTDGAVPASATAVIYNSAERRDVLRFYPASRFVLIDRRRDLRAVDYAAECGSGSGELSGEFERNLLPDLSR